MSKTCIVVPCYNEENRLDLSTFSGFLAMNPDVRLCFVNDGSSDGTMRILSEFREKEGEGAMVIDLKHNQGKAEAVRLGVMGCMEQGDFDYIGYWDADLATPLSEYQPMVDIMEKDKQKMAVLGSRIQRLGSRISRQSSRHYSGRVFSTIASYILKFPVYDSQCGSKLFRKELARQLFNEQFISQWLFDIELLLRYRNLSGTDKLLETLVEYPLGSWIEMGDSKLKFAHLMRMPKQFYLIHHKYNIKH